MKDDSTVRRVDRYLKEDNIVDQIFTSYIYHGGGIYF